MTVTEETQDHGPGIDPERLAVCLGVLDELDALEVDHPDAIRVRRATAGIYRTVKQRRRQERRAAKTANDKAVTEATATGSAQRIDDETEGLLPTSVTEEGRIAGILQRPRSCYVCKTRFVEVDYFYHQLCQKCAAENRTKREARADLTGKRALLTGGRAKIGMYIALRLLRDGAHHRHHPLPQGRHPPLQGDGGLRGLAAPPGGRRHRPARPGPGRGPRRPGDRGRSAGHPHQQRDPDRAPPALRVRRPGRGRERPAARRRAALHHVIGAFNSGAVDGIAALPLGTSGLEAQKVADLALVAGNASIARHLDGTAIDAGGLVPDVVDTNTWVQSIDQISPVELLETQLCNYTAPFILISKLRPVMAEAARKAASGRAYVVNVSAMEGVFGRGYKGAGHPNTNAAKAAMNMVTRTSAQEMFQTDGILMTSVDTGWITDERPHFDKLRLAERASTPRSTWSTARPGSTTRSCAARRARTCTASSSRTTPPATGSPAPRRRTARRSRSGKSAPPARWGALSLISPERVTLPGPVERIRAHLVTLMSTVGHRGDTPSSRPARDWPATKAAVPPDERRHRDRTALVLQVARH